MKSNCNRHTLLLVTVVLALMLLFLPGVQAQGIDVSKYQGKVNWTKVAKSKKVKFVYATG